MPSTERTTRLKDRLRWKHNVSGEFVDENVKAGVERIRYLTESYKQTAGEPEVIRRAKAVANVLNKMTINIQEDELIVGDTEGNPNWFPLYPELSYNTCLDFVLSDTVVEEFKEEIEELVEWWKPHTLQSKCEGYYRKEQLDVMYGFALVEPPSFVNTYMSIVPTYETVLEDGLLKRIEIIEQKLEETKKEFQDSECWIASEHLKLTDKIDLYKAMIISCKATIAWCRRYSRLAKIVAGNFEKDPVRKEELLQISDICWRVPAEPCKGFWDSMQAKWFIFEIAQSLERYGSGFSHLEDRLHWPYYKTSVIDKSFQPMTRERAQELVECERFKISERGVGKGRLYRYAFPGTNDLHILTIGGLDENDNDACNELTNVILDAARSTRTPEPSIGFRFHPKINNETKYKVFQCIADGLGFPSIKHEELNVRQLEKFFGTSHKDARSWALVLCMSPGITGRRATQKTRSEGGGGQPHVAKLLEICFYDGFDPTVNDMQLGAHTGDPRNFKSVDDILEALRKQIEIIVRLFVSTKDTSRKYECAFLECPLVSAIDDACVEKGIGSMSLVDVPNPWMQFYTIVDTADSLAALKKFVFEEQKYTMEQVVEALKANYEGYEEMRRDFLSAPKYGNDDPYVDDLAVKIYDLCHDACMKHRVFSGVPIYPGSQSVSMYSVAGPRIGALPSGRKHGEVVADGGVSPYVGMDKKGPTAVLKSAARIDHSKFKFHQLNQRLSHSLMHSDKGFDFWLAYMNTWYDLNIDHIQFNVVRNEDMRAAQEEPEIYGDLIVRIAGYSARFVNLTRYTQDSIIARTEQDIHSVGV